MKSKRLGEFRLTTVGAIGAVAVAALVAGCGGGGSSGSSSGLKLSGTAATGTAVANKAVDARCATGTGTATTGADGSYAMTIADGVLPCVTRVTTADGTMGVRGFVTAAVDEFPDRTFLYACGPLPMLRAVEAIDGPGYFFQPTVIDKLSPQSAIMREEIFGPVLGIIRFSTEEEAVEIANNTEYGLVSYVFTENLARGQRMIEKLETGMMGLNTGLVSNAAAPFGGLKQSGIGREGGFEGIHEFLSTKYTLIPR